MKRIFTVLIAAICLFFVNDIKAQTKEQLLKGMLEDTAKQAKTLIRAVDDLKSGNRLDVLSSFFQIAINDLTGANRALEFKANLFALKAKADSTLLVDTNYLKQGFSRNFQFDFALKLDSQYKFKSFKAGFTWAIINKRDSSVLNLIGSPADSAFGLAINSLSLAFDRFRATLVDPKTNSFKSKEDEHLFNRAKNTRDSLLSLGFSIGKPSLFPKEFISFLNFEATNKNLALFDSLYNEELRKLRQRPLLTLSANGTFANQPGLFKEGKTELVFLQGLTKKGRNLELDLRASVDIIDTVINNLNNRIEFNSTAGFNWAIITSSKNINKSLVEFKPHIEFNSVLRGVYIGEKKQTFLANAELRIRVFDNLWIPLTLKYDLKDHNFLGFLKVALNMNAFKKASK